MTPERLLELREKAQPKGQPCGYYHWVGLEHIDILALFDAVATKNYLLEQARRAMQRVLESPDEAPTIIAEQLAILSRLYETCGWTGRPQGGSCVDLVNNGGIAGSTGCDLHYPRPDKNDSNVTGVRGARACGCHTDACTHNLPTGR